MNKGIPADSEEGRLIAEDYLHLSGVIFEGNKELEEKFWMCVNRRLTLLPQACTR
ncbi:hypothetical protein [Peribacillus butanolivorans]|uniref:hypothetical protein n=1 Tax=Peribacillus butanolivorans TaxID=421767 RepID=UPI0013C2BE34|nr:hypothetical protein [Peribacillus butanolivorans]